MGETRMALLSRSAQLTVDRAKDDIDTLNAKIKDLELFSKTVFLNLYTRQADRIVKEMADLEESTVRLVQNIFGPNSEESQLISPRLRFAALPSGLDQDGIKRELERNVTKIQEALEEAIKLLEGKIAAARGQARAPEEATAAKPPTTPSDKPLISWKLKIPFTGIEIDANELLPVPKTPS